MGKKQDNKIPPSKLLRIDRYQAILDDDGLYYVNVYNISTRQYEKQELRYSSKKDALLAVAKLNSDSEPLTLALNID